MFTGLIEEVGRVLGLERGRPSRLIVGARDTLSDLALGSSIAVNGACLTVTHLSPTTFEVDLSPETLSRTTLGDLKAGDRVNLERPLRLGDRLGGHLVSGHIDGVGTIRALRSADDLLWIDFSYPPSMASWLVSKGSVAVDGISLTLAEIGEAHFSVQVIPFTHRKTNLGEKRVGDKVNLEGDLMAKYVQRHLSSFRGDDQKGRIDRDFLSQHGFIPGHERGE